MMATIDIGAMVSIVPLPFLMQARANTRGMSVEARAFSGEVLPIKAQAEVTHCSLWSLHQDSTRADIEGLATDFLPELHLLPGGQTAKDGEII